MTTLDIEEVNSVGSYEDYKQQQQRKENDSAPLTPMESTAAASREPQSTEYEVCLYCGRRFFEGRLVYHNKLCTEDNPMVLRSVKKSSAPSQKRHLDAAAQTKYRPRGRDLNAAVIGRSVPEICDGCGVKLPACLMEPHKEKCRALFQMQGPKSGRKRPIVLTLPKINEVMKSPRPQKIAVRALRGNAMTRLAYSRQSSVSNSLATGQLNLQAKDVCAECFKPTLSVHKYCGFCGKKKQ